MNIRGIVWLGGMLLLMSCASPTEFQSHENSLLIPQGEVAILDGTISAEEWQDARQEVFSEGGELLLMHNNGYLYLGIRANTDDMIVGNIFVEQGEHIAVLHSSAALGTALYSEVGDEWQRTKGFEWRCRSTGDGASAKAERENFLQDA